MAGALSWPESNCNRSPQIKALSAIWGPAPISRLLNLASRSSSSHYLKAPIYLSPLFFWKNFFLKKGVITAALPGGGERAGQPRRTDGATAAALPGGGERPGGAEDEAPRLLRPRRRATAPGRQWRPSGGGRSLAVEAGATPLPRMVLTATNGGGMSRRRRVAGVGAS